MHQRSHYHDDQAAYQPTYNQQQQQQRGIDQYDDYSESSWNAQYGHGAENKFSSGGRYGSQEEIGQWRQQSKFGKQYGSDEQLFNRQQYGSGSTARFGGPSTDDDFEFDDFSGTTGTGYPTDTDSQEDYIKSQTESGDIADDIGRKVAQKMVKFFNIVQKYAARNGTVPTEQAQDPLAFRQWALPMKHHQYLNMNECKAYGLSQGIFKAMDLNTEKNSVSARFFFF